MSLPPLTEADLSVIERARLMEIQRSTSSPVELAKKLQEFWIVTQHERAHLQNVLDRWPYTADEKPVLILWKQELPDDTEPVALAVFDPANLHRLVAREERYARNGERSVHPLKQAVSQLSNGNLLTGERIANLRFWALPADQSPERPGVDYDRLDQMIERLPIPQRQDFAPQPQVEQSGVEL